jgi:hypothetical protein
MAVRKQNIDAHHMQGGERRTLTKVMIYGSPTEPIIRRVMDSGEERSIGMVPRFEVGEMICVTL